MGRRKFIYLNISIFLKSSLFLKIVTGIFALQQFSMLKGKIHNGLLKIAIASVIVIVIIIIPASHGGGYFI